MENDILLRINNEVNTIKEKINNLDKQKMSRQKLQCTESYKQNLREQRRLEDVQRKYELQKEIISNPNKSLTEWESIFDSEAKKQKEKNSKDFEKKRISEKTYKKRERLIEADFKLKIEELIKLKKEIEEYGISKILLINELDKRIEKTKMKINTKKEERKLLRQQNELNNKRIEIKKEEYALQLKELEISLMNNQYKTKEVIEVKEKVQSQGQTKVQPHKKAQVKDDFDFKTNKNIGKTIEEHRDLDFKSKEHKDFPKENQLGDISFGNQKTTKPSVPDIETSERKIIVNNTKSEKPKVVSVVGKGFFELGYSVEELMQYDKETVFDFEGVKNLGKKEKKYFRKLGKNARRKGLNVIGYEATETGLIKLLNTIFRKKENVEVKDIEEFQEEMIDQNWRSTYIVSTRNDLFEAQKDHTYSNNRKKVAMTR